MKVIEEPQLALKRKLPWFVGVLLYPASAHSITYIAIFLFLLFLIGLLDKFVLPYARHYGGIFSLLLNVLLIGYIFYYFTYCIFDSSRGGLRAPNISTEHAPDKADLILQLFLILGSVAICFWPTAVYYYIIAKRIDLTFWVLAAGGTFFFPMALLASVLFDSADALNPILIIGSILKTPLSYCGLILSFCIFGGLVAVIFLVLERLPVLGFISKAVTLYLLFVAAHLLGRFYWWHKDKLDWGI
ncbi:MAG: hypothetical protein ACYS83_07370 [Planctomycetota bacterium]